MRKYDQYLIKFYLILQAILFFAIKWAEITQAFSVYSKVEYASIFLNFLMMLYFYMQRKGEKFIPLALTLTLFADYFLTLRGSHFNLGVSLFILVQFTYGHRIGYTEKNILLRRIFFIGFFCLMYVLGMPVSFSILCGLSIAFLLGNVIVSLAAHLRSRDVFSGLFALGLLLFMGCDLSLGLGKITAQIGNMEGISHIFNLLVWTFYVPAQVLLVMSYIREEGK